MHRFGLLSLGLHSALLVSVLAPLALPTGEPASNPVLVEVMFTAEPAGSQEPATSRPALLPDLPTRSIEAEQRDLRGLAEASNAFPEAIPASVDSSYHNPQPTYPPLSIRRSEQGDVLLLVHITPAGRAGHVDVLRGSGYALLDRAAQDAVSTWRFLPAVENNEPIPYDLPLRIAFHLD